jgi:protein involved in polysaccharide export with SLBB domain
VALPADSAAAWPNDLALREFDIVTIYGRPEMRDSIMVSITGVVNEPGRYPWRRGMTLRDLLLMSRGLRIGAWLQEAEIARLPADRSRGEMAQTIRVPLDSTYLFDRDSLGRYIGPPGTAVRGSGAPEVYLEPFDNVLILRQPDFELQRTVKIYGEVTFPGSYALRAKDDRLADLLQRAGGLTPRAYADGIRFFRPDNNAGRINIDLPRALRDGGARDNVILQPGDSIFIPEYQPSVRVAGAVNAPGSVLWRRGAGMGYYISAAGGFSRNADKGGANVRQANGEVQTGSRFLFFTSEPEPRPGAEIVVPARDPSDRTDKVALFGNIAQVLASLVTIAVVATRL